MKSFGRQNSKSNLVKLSPSHIHTNIEMMKAFSSHSVRVGKGSLQKSSIEKTLPPERE